MESVITHNFSVCVCVCARARVYQHVHAHFETLHNLFKYL
jgi:hypothetical protein